MGLILNTKKIAQNNQEYLLGIFRISDVLKFTRYTEYTILGFDEENKPITNNQVQRRLDKKKVESISNFLINDPQAMFPTNIVIAIPNHAISSYEESDNNEIIIELADTVEAEIERIDKGEDGDIYLSVIDGQHRVKGIQIALEKLTNLIENYDEEVSDGNDGLTDLEEKLENLRNFELSVAFFIDPVLEYQAMIFSTINRTQTRVNQDLVYSLFGLTEDDSPQKTALNIVNVLNGTKKSPFYKRIRLAGSNSKAGKEFYADGYPILSQATMVKSILYMITKDSREAEVERNKPRKYFKKHPNDDLFFRKYYAEDNDSVVMKIMFYFFSAVQDVFIDSDGNSFWDIRSNKNKPTNIIQTTIGYEALLDVLKRILSEEKSEDRLLDKNTYIGYLIKANGIDILDNNDPKKFPFTNRSKKLFYDEMERLIWGV
ncbi:MAG: DGQHR domain-containing protein [Bacteroidaceae bacterium]|nr:DGQHR domain-containing protein [Bacteroidaceae bacterium]